MNKQTLYKNTLTNKGVTSDICDYKIKRASDSISCSYCNKEISHSASYEDGRELCKKCFDNSVHTQEEALEFLPKLINDMKKFGIDCQNMNIPLRLINRKSMEHESKSLKNFIPIGLTSRYNLNSYNSSRQIVHREPVIDSVLILNGLSVTDFCMTLVHELGHCWIHHQDFPQLEPYVEEGLCELLSCIWLKQQNIPERGQKIQNLLNYSSDVYKKGLNRAMIALKDYSFKEIIQYISLKGIFPPRYYN